MDSTSNLELLTQLEASRTLALALQTAFQNNDKAELIHVAEVVKACAKRLIPEFEPLLLYARGVAKWAGSDITGAIHEFRSLRKVYLLSRPGCYSVDLTTQQGCIKISDVLLDMPAEIFWHVTVPTGGDHFSILPTKITDAEILTTSLQQLGFTVKTNADVRGYRGQRITADVVAILEGEYDLSWSRNRDGKFDLIGDLRGVAVSYNQTELIQSINQQYALNKTWAEQETSEQNN